MGSDRSAPSSHLSAPAGGGAGRSILPRPPPAIGPGVSGRRARSVRPDRRGPRSARHRGRARTVAVSSPDGSGTFTVQMDFTRFFEESAPGLVRLCYLATLDLEAATDAAQEAMTRAWRDWERIGADGSDPGAWTRTVALNLCRDEGRRAQRRTRIDLDDALAAAPSAAAGLDDDLDLHAALAGLSERQREAVALRYWADLDVVAVAATMGVSVGSVKQHLARARRHLADALGPRLLDDLEVEAQ